MPDDLDIRQPQDGEKINRNQEHEIRDWTKELGVTKEDLLKVIDKVGPIVTDVKRELGK